jgi:hypothetical protein
MRNLNPHRCDREIDILSASAGVASIRLLLDETHDGAPRLAC